MVKQKLTLFKQGCPPCWIHDIVDNPVCAVESFLNHLLAVQDFVNLYIHSLIHLPHQHPAHLPHQVPEVRGQQQFRVVGVRDTSGREEHRSNLTNKLHYITVHLLYRIYMI